jgi:16S rRNA C967 or C1407 C5-methylase (RsmB/RsmF family)/NOL1/NOP2/fmu family ribosome biogenesis protein
LLPESLLDQLLPITGFDRSGFLHAHLSVPPPTSIRLNPSKMPALSYAMEPIGWSRYGYYLAQRPSFTFDPLFHAGCYYVQEASSMLLEQAFTQLMPQDGPLRALDLCAAPGGKASHLYSLLPVNSFLVANEVIRSRALVLRDNLIRWGTKNALVTNNDPEQFRALSNYFDWITVDAPCSGSGLFRKDPDAIEHWSETAVQHCSQRQQRIVAAAWQSLRPGGILFYSTCSYSVEENETLARWLIAGAKAIPRELSLPAAWKITATDPGYRCWPDKTRGEGFYFCCLQKPLDPLPSFSPRHGKDFRFVEKKEQVLLDPWINKEDVAYISLEQAIYAWPNYLRQEWQALATVLNILYSGIRIGQLMRDKLVPDHALAQSNCLSHSVSSVSLTISEAISYLQRKPFTPANPAKGWTVVNYQNFSLGWINALSNRTNNYYPKELRIIKESQSAQ